MPPINPIAQLLSAGESQTLEFKTSFDKATVESLVAFANAQGGTVVVGVSNAGGVVGATLGKETLNEWLGQIKSATSPSLIPDFSVEDVDGKTVIVIHISEFPVKPVSTRGRYFKRVASSNHQLGPTEIADLYMQSLQLSWDAYTAPNESLEALSLPKINRFVSQVQNWTRNDHDHPRNSLWRFRPSSVAVAACRFSKTIYGAVGHDQFISAGSRVWPKSRAGPAPWAFDG